MLPIVNPKRELLCVSMAEPVADRGTLQDTRGSAEWELDVITHTLS